MLKIPNHCLIDTHTLPIKSQSQNDRPTTAQFDRVVKSIDATRSFSDYQCNF